ncbi:MAG: diacylglycerol kinase [Bacteroidetes bacterium HGW-Bacteroidetes-11]|jgi:YegS/Rv2252/BmrU family lipid kinase|nr:MAG: diacylglycerol kinase [Bacteroidetes bacterium HGW-Bacteroidetes-11]
MSDVMQRIQFLVNPTSGVNQSRKALLADIAKEVLDASRFTWEVSFSESSGHMRELSQNAAASGVDIIVAVGGDGTVNQVVKGMYGSEAVLAIIPAGSGNGLAHHLHIPADIAAALKIINLCQVKAVDTCFINDELFVSIAGVGFDALVAKKFAVAKHRGFLSYLGIVTNEYTYYRPRKYKLTIDGQLYRREALFVSFANTNQFGYNTIIAPDAKIDDGLIDVCIMKKVPLILAPGIVGLLLTRKIDSSNYIEIIKAKEVSFTRRKNRVVNIDGEPVKLTKNIHVRVNPASLKVIVP